MYITCEFENQLLDFNRQKEFECILIVWNDRHRQKLMEFLTSITISFPLNQGKYENQLFWEYILSITKIMACNTIGFVVDDYSKQYSIFSS